MNFQLTARTIEMTYAYRKSVDCIQAPMGPGLDPLALQQMQTQDFDTPKEILFASTMSVFQDSGLTIEASDLATGFITAKSPTRVAEIG